MEVRNSNFAAFIDVFTSNTYVMVIMSDPSIREWQIRPFSAVTVAEGIKTVLFKQAFLCSSQPLQPLSSTSGMLGNTLRSWSGWMDPNTACTCECASDGAGPSGHSQPIRPQTTCGGLPEPTHASSPALRCLCLSQSRRLSLCSDQQTALPLLSHFVYSRSVVLSLGGWGWGWGGGLNDECSSK